MTLAFSVIGYSLEDPLTPAWDSRKGLTQPFPYYILPGARVGRGLQIIGNVPHQPSPSWTFLMMKINDLKTPRSPATRVPKLVCPGIFILLNTAEEILP